MKWNAEQLFGGSSNRYNTPSDQRATIVAPVGKNVYKIRDPLGRLSNVFSSSSYNTGDTVRVMSGQVVSRTAMVSKIKLFEV